MDQAALTNELRKIVDAAVAKLADRLAPRLETRQAGAATMPPTWSSPTSAIASAGSATGNQVDLAGRTITSLLTADAGGVVEVAFGDPADATSPTAAATAGIAREWFPLAPGGSVDAPGGQRFTRFRVRLATGTLADTRRVILAVDTVGGSQTVREAGRFANISPGGSIASLERMIDETGTEVSVQGANGSSATLGVPGVAGHVAGQSAVTFEPLEVDATGRANVNPIVGQAGVAAGTGNVGATTVRTVEAADGPVSTSLVTLAGRDVNAGAAGAQTPRVAPATVATGASTTVATTTGASTQVVASNARRKRCALRNNTTTIGADLYFAVGTAAVVGVGPVINPGQAWDVEAVGAINVIRAGATDVSVGAYDESR